MLRLRACILTHFLSSNSASPISPLHRLLSAAAVSPSPRFAVEEYLVETCGLTRDQALKASGKISHLKSPSKPDAVLAFLAGLGLSSADVIALVAKDPGFLCASVEKTLEPVVSVYARETRIFSGSTSFWGSIFTSSEDRTHSSARDNSVNKSYASATPSMEHSFSSIQLKEPSENHSEQESSEIAITKLLLQSYYSIVRKNVEDFVPKAIMHFLVNHTKWELHNFLITTLYKEEIFGDILIEPDEITTKRKQICETLKVLQQAYKLLKGRCKATLRDELPDFLEHAVSLDELHFNVDLYFLHLKKEEGDTIDWYFDSRSKFEGDGQSKFEDYHRLVLKNHLPTEVYVYRNYDRYRSLFTTYEMDKDYVNFVEEMSGKLNWLKSGVGFPETSDVWEDMHSRGALQVLKIAEQYTHMNFVLAYTAYREYIWSLRFHYLYRGDKDGLFFVIWKHTTKGQLTFEAALGELLRQNLFPRHKNLIQRELEKVFWCGLKEEYNSCVEGIPVNASEDDAKALIGGAVLKLHKGKKPLHQYMERKMHIARSIGLVKCLT